MALAQPVRDMRRVRGRRAVWRADPPTLVPASVADPRLADEADTEPGLLDLSRPELSPAPRRAVATAGDRMLRADRKWLGALAASLVLHAGAAAFLLYAGSNTADIAGGEQAGVQMAGNAAENQQAAGDLVDPAEVTNVTIIPMSAARPVEPEPLDAAQPAAEIAAVSAEPSTAVRLDPVAPDVSTPAKPATLEPLEAEPPKPAQVEATTRTPHAAPTPTIEPAVTAKTAQPVEPAETTAATASDASAIEPLSAPRHAAVAATTAQEAAPVLTSERPTKIREAELAPTVSGPAVQAAAEPLVVQEERPQPPLQPMEDKASQAEHTIAAPHDVARPSPRPAPVVAAARPEPALAKPARKQQPRDKAKSAQSAQPARPAKAGQPAKKAQPAKLKAGSGGTQRADTRRGADGADRGNAASKIKSAEPRSAQGNAAVSNYPGKVVSKLRRALRYPAEAKRQRLRGETHVRFTVFANGTVGSVRLVRGSGSPVLDKAAMEAVRRAAPFPAIPSDAGRSSWAFTVPLAFTR